MSSRLCFFALLVTLGWPLTLSAEESFRFESTPGKLPTDVVPKSYDIHLKPEIEKRTFTGSETLALEVRKPVKTIMPNANALTIPSGAGSRVARAAEVIRFKTDSKTRLLPEIGQWLKTSSPSPQPSS